MKFFLSFIKYKIIFPFYFSIVKLFSSVDENSVVIDSKGNTKIDESFKFLLLELQNQKYSIYTYLSRKNLFSDLYFLKKVASAKFIFLSDFHFLLDNIRLSKKQVVINLCHGCGIFKKFGYCTENESWGGYHSNKKN